jgi:hypothetical protein
MLSATAAAEFARTLRLVDDKSDMIHLLAGTASTAANI